MVNQEGQTVTKYYLQLYGKNISFKRKTFLRQPLQFYGEVLNGGFGNSANVRLQPPPCQQPHPNFPDVALASTAIHHPAAAAPSSATQQGMADLYTTVRLTEGDSAQPSASNDPASGAKMAEEAWVPMRQLYQTHRL